MQQLADRGLPETRGLDSLRRWDGRASYVSGTAEDQPPSSSACLGSSRTNCTQYSREIRDRAIALGSAPRYVVVLQPFAGWYEHGSVAPAKTVGATYRPQHQKWQDVFFKKGTAAGAISF